MGRKGPQEACAGPCGRTTVDSCPGSKGGFQSPPEASSVSMARAERRALG